MRPSYIAHSCKHSVLVRVEPVWGSGDVLIAACRDNEMDGGSCSNQTAHSHDAWEKTRSTCHTDLPNTFLKTHTHTHTDPRGAGAKHRQNPLNMPSELTISKRRRRRGKNVNTVEDQSGPHIDLWFLLVIWRYIPFQQTTCCRDQPRLDLARFSAPQTPVHPSWGGSADSQLLQQYGNKALEVSLIRSFLTARRYT